VPPNVVSEFAAFSERTDPAPAGTVFIQDRRHAPIPRPLRPQSQHPPARWRSGYGCRVSRRAQSGKLSA